MKILGIDIGGSAIKGAIVDVNHGQLASDRARIKLPEPSTPQAVAECVVELVNSFGWRGSVGCTFPGIISHGRILSAANVDKNWIGTDARTLFEEKAQLPMMVINDADAAGIAEMEFGAGEGKGGVVIMLTFGTGIGSAIFTEGVLLPNAELGHLKIRGKDAELRAAARVKKEEKLSWKQWSQRVQEFLDRLDFLFSPDLYIIGGGISKKHEKFIPLLTSRAEIVPAKLFNDAGIVGVAYAARKLKQED